MKAFGWAVAISMATAVVAAIVSVVSGWNVYHVSSILLSFAVFWLCEEVWGE